MKARFDANGDVIVITGGANGIGQALARAAAAVGARVIVCDLDQKAVDQLVSEDGSIAVRELDVSNRNAVMDIREDRARLRPH